MAFGVDYSKASEGGLIPEGEYEVIIKNAGEDVTKNGTHHLSIPMIVRNDIEQPRKNARIWHKIWKKKEPTETDNQCGGFSSAQIQSLSKAAGLPNGKQYADLGEWCEDLNAKLARVTVKHEDWNGNTNARVAFVNPSKHSVCNHIFKSSDGVVPANSFQEVDDDGDLPF